MQVKNFVFNPRDLLGAGAFAKVYRGTDLTNKEPIAIKQIDRRQYLVDAYLLKALNQEIEIVRHFRHPNIVRLTDIVETERHIYIVTELCEDGDLQTVLRNGRITERQSIEIMR